MNKPPSIIVIGAGAAGMFFVNQLIDSNIGNCNIKVLEMGNKPLAKVKISGGGRCNVTHACFDPGELVKFYPRGERELRSGFSRFCTGDTMEWFGEKGVPLKIEEDNRIFPTTDSSQTIIDCLMRVEKDKRVAIHYQTAVKSLHQEHDGSWLIKTNKGELGADVVLVATGGSKAAWRMMGDLGLSLVAPVPSLFTFDQKPFEWKHLAGVSLPAVSVEIEGMKLRTEGPMLITHWGFSGPAILRMSAEAARDLHELNYHFTLIINFSPHITESQSLDELQICRKDFARQKIANKPYAGIPARLWKTMLDDLGIGEARWADLTNKQLEGLHRQLHRATFSINNKSTNKEEFVTAGGIELKELNFKTMEAKRYPRLHIAGEVLDIDAVTGGFNFQAAWTTAWVAAQAVAGRLAR